jgi:hypothetical protein
MLIPLALPQQAFAVDKCVRSSIASTPGRDFYKCPDGTSMKVTPLTETRSKAITSDGRKLICSKKALTGNLSCR